ncbi:MAG TPA: hypothetical protein QGG47_02355 [Acidobacteriota bacterium]|nr:hypothetical protein [Acidobacteriota bacterium]
MYEIDPLRTDLAEEFCNNPGGPYSAELTLVVNRLRVMPMADRHILVCTQRGRQWMLARMPSKRGTKLELFEDHVFDDYYEGVWEVFKRRWRTVTGTDLSGLDRRTPGVA